MYNNRKNIRSIDDIDGINIQYWEMRECPICHTKFYARKKYNKITCSEECYKKYYEEHLEEIREKQRIASYNAFHSKTKEEIDAEHEKARRTCLERYGAECLQKTDEYRKKLSKKFKEKDWSERSKKVNEGLKVKYNKICKEDDLELIEFRNRFDCTVKCKKCGNVFDIHVLGYLTEKTNHNLCKHCHPNVNSTSETTPLKFVEQILIENNIPYIKNDRSLLKPYEIDILVKEKNIGFEINGNYWHSEFASGKSRFYHINKTKKGYENGIKLIQIYEDEIVNLPEIVKSRIKNLLGITDKTIYARKCVIKEINTKEKKNFLNENHIDGDSVSKINVGLFYNNELVSVGTFGKRKISGKSQYELIRFASKINTNVVGGFSKILSYFLKNYKPDTIITYADIRWSGIDHENNVYQNNGFSFVKETLPNYFYQDKKNYLVRLNRLNFTKLKLVKRGFDKHKTEIQIMLENGYDRIWDCGSMKFELNKKGNH